MISHLSSLVILISCCIIYADPSVNTISVHDFETIDLMHQYGDGYDTSLHYNNQQLNCLQTTCLTKSFILHSPFIINYEANIENKNENIAGENTLSMTFYPPYGGSLLVLDDHGGYVTQSENYADLSNHSHGITHNSCSSWPIIFDCFFSDDCVIDSIFPAEMPSSSYSSSVTMNYVGGLTVPPSEDAGN